MERKKHWIDSLDWNSFRPELVDPELLRLVQSAALLQANSQDCAAYLQPLFPGDEGLCDKIRTWAWEETMQGQALARWASLAAPEYSLEEALDRFRHAYRVPKGATCCMRGTPAKELLARCVVETGTVTFYRALMDRAEEPVLKEICRRIAAEAIRHYKLFLEEFRRLNRDEKCSILARWQVVRARMSEVEKEEFAAAYYAAGEETEGFDMGRHGRAYLSLAFGLYGPEHAQLAVKLLEGALQVKLPAGVSGLVARLSARRLAKQSHRFRAEVATLA